MGPFPPLFSGQRLFICITFIEQHIEPTARFFSRLLGQIQSKEAHSEHTATCDGKNFHGGRRKSATHKSQRWAENGRGEREAGRQTGRFWFGPATSRGLGPCSPPNLRNKFLHFTERLRKTLPQSWADELRAKS